MFSYGIKCHSIFEIPLDVTFSFYNRLMGSDYENQYEGGILRKKAKDEYYAMSALILKQGKINARKNDVKSVR